MYKPPIVWHLDADSITDFSYNPEDRLTRIKKLMKDFQTDDSKMSLKVFQATIVAICEEGNKSV
jgi:hypothetical protein